ncbi:hypothetical protein CMO83_04850 [Candidatus Woesearchaeota archaeon]|jgi:glucose uptake protein GlcU|nr:hypothetical protein [Candidatus Woesearchaeota archaeon]MDP6648205.1 GRP family sugar transporter [Candidatus Woesearchaeota archaeon]|tara:strand:+ start:38567 stop:39412 length:846 start_codon:yes stop_codon:yes gene_type:complete
MSTTIGIISAAVAAIGWGSYFVPMKKIKKFDPFYFQLLICIGVLISSSIIVFLYGSFSLSYYGILSGVLWTIGNVLVIFAVNSLGLARTGPISGGIVSSMSFLWGLLYFKEIISSLLFGIVGIFLLIMGIVLISATTKNSGSYNFKGLIFAVSAAVLFGMYIVPLKVSGLEPMQFLFSMSLGIFASGLVFYLIKFSKFDKEIIISGLSSGVLWNIANIASFFAVANLGLAIGFPLTQIALFVNVLWGLVYFHEITERKKIIKLGIGAVVLFTGAVLLGISV